MPIDRGEIRIRDRGENLHPDRMAAERWGQAGVRLGGEQRHDVNFGTELKKNFVGAWMPSKAFVLHSGKLPAKDVFYIKDIEVQDKIAPGKFVYHVGVQNVKIGHRNKAITCISNVVNILETYPSFGLINYNNIVVNCMRSPARQWKRGYNKNIIKLSSPVQDEMHILGQGNEWPDVNYSDFVKNLFIKNFLPIKAAYRRVAEAKVLGSCFNARYAMVMKNGSTKVLVAYKNDIVGYVNDDNLKVTIPKCVVHLKEELSQYTEVIVK